MGRCYTSGGVIDSGASCSQDGLLPERLEGNIYDVTLSHFYSELGRSLTEWPLWTRFVADLHPKLFRMSGVSKHCS